MNRRILFRLLLPVVFVSAAIVGAKSGRAARETTGRKPIPYVRSVEPAISGSEIPTTDFEAKPVPRPKSDSKPAMQESSDGLEARLDDFYRAMTDKTLCGDELQKRIPWDLVFSEETGRLARDRYLRDLAGGRIDPDWLWIVFRCGGDGLNGLLLERLRDGAADLKEKEAILVEVDRFSGIVGMSGGLFIDDAVFTRATSMARSPAPVDRMLAARLMGNRDSVPSRDALWQMGGLETDPAAQIAIVESLSRVADTSIHTFDRVGAMLKSYDLSAFKGKQFQRLIAAQNEIMRRCREAYERQNPGTPK